MRANIRIFWIVAIFMVLIDVVYAIWSTGEYGKPEWVGTVAMLLTGVLCAFIAFYLTLSYRRQGGELPEDLGHSAIDDGDPEIGFFSPWSWWPFALGAAGGLFMLGLSVGIWLCFIAAPIALICVVGWVFEYYRGNFAR